MTLCEKMREDINNAKQKALHFRSLKDSYMEKFWLSAAEGLMIKLQNTSIEDLARCV